MSTVDGYFFIFDTRGEEKNESENKNKLVRY